MLLCVIQLDRSEKKKNPQSTFEFLMMRERVVRERLGPLLRKGCVFLVSTKETVIGRA